jgi:hypothetical protein
MSLTQKTKIWHNNAVSRRFGRYSFQKIFGKLNKRAAPLFAPLQYSNNNIHSPFGDLVTREPPASPSQESASK